MARKISIEKSSKTKKSTKSASSGTKATEMKAAGAKKKTGRSTSKREEIPAVARAVAQKKNATKRPASRPRSLAQ